MTETEAVPPDVSALDRLFHPRSIAVIGASTTRLNLGTTKLRRLREFGYPGRLYVVHPDADVVEGVRAVPTVEDLPGTVDYAFITLPAPLVPDVVRRCAGRARVVQVASAGFSETGNLELERELVDAATEAGVRLVGPNCLGVHSTASRVTFLDGVSTDRGPVSIASQSGGLASDMLRTGEVQGLRFNELVTLGNSIDIDVNEVVERFAADPATAIVGLYVESVHDGERFFHGLRRLAAQKPVVLLRGGVTDQGGRSAASHTGGMATPAAVWHGLCKQLGVLVVDTLNQFLSVLAALSDYNRKPLRRLALVGPGGGASVVASDAADRLGYELVPFAPATREHLADIGVPAGSSLGNPVDLPVGALDSLGTELVGRILRGMVDLEQLDLLVLHLNLNNFLSFTEGASRTVGDLVDAFSNAEDLPVQRALVLRSTGDPATEGLKSDQRVRAARHGQVTFDSIESALESYAAVASWQERWATRVARGAPSSPYEPDTWSQP